MYYGLASKCTPRLILRSRYWCMLALLTLLHCVLAQQAIDLIDFNKLKNSPQARQNPATHYRLKQWQTALESFEKLDRRQQLIEINDFFNSQLIFKSDQNIWKESDYWATPLESLDKAAGDCEDFTIAKYISLLALGIPPEQLRLVYVKAKLPSDANNSHTMQAHMVLAYYPTINGIPLILDNLNRTVKPANLRSDLQPVFSFNGQGLWLQGQTISAVKNPESRLSRWRSVLERMRRQGIHHS